MCVKLEIDSVFSKVCISGIYRTRTSWTTNRPPIVTRRPFLYLGQSDKVRFYENSWKTHEKPAENTCKCVSNLPINTHIRVLITSTDVIHAWAIPSLGIKCDAYPGRLNQVSTFIKREGIFHGQCSELCGVNHGFMPIVVEAVTLQDYVSWISAKLEDA